MGLNQVGLAAENAIKLKEKNAEKIRGQKRFGMSVRLKAAKRSGTEIEVAAKMICRICNGGQA